jgi:MtaA/CmuA family methyltransferase
MSTVYPNSRAEVLALLHGRRLDRRPRFSGLISVTQAGLQQAGLTLSGVHTDPAQLAAAAASSYRLTGFESAVVPCDLCVEAEALGAVLDYRADDSEPQLPRVLGTVAESAAAFRVPAEGPIMRRGRLPVVGEALAQLRSEVGDDVVIGAFVPGPLTLAMQVIDTGPLLMELSETPDVVARLLDTLTPVLIEVAQFYRASGADFITVHEMGGSPGYLGPGPFEHLVLPRLQQLLAALPAPRVLSVCGRTNRAIQLVAAAGADALSVDQTNDLEASRAALGPDVRLFGNIDPIGVLADGDEATVTAAVRAAITAGADAIWPGCDLYPLMPAANLRALVTAA